MVGGSLRTLAILGFHQIGESPEWESWFYIPERTFAEQLRFLREDGWQVLGVETFLRGLEEPETLPERSALLTFDDGCRKFLDPALEYLRRFQYPAVHFVPTEYIGKYNSFDAGEEPEERILSWDDLRMLERHGISIESHAVSHRPFSKLTLAQQEEELRISKAMLEEGLEKRVEMFAFPQGDEGGDPQAIEAPLRHAGYRAAFLYGGGPVQLPGTSHYRLSRLAMGPDTDLARALAAGAQEGTS
jgi:peptidoglycan/xylan/chitin deacetylase (PgdA/CDA1 family)